MPLDILAALHTLPDLVISTVFDFLPVSLVIPFCSSANAEFRELALRQEWRWIQVGTIPGYNTDDLSQRLYYEVSNIEFYKMVRDWVPPPYPMRCLRYSTTSALDDPLFMTPEWCEYVAEYAKAVMLAIDIKGGNDPHYWRVLPLLGQLNLVHLRFAATGSDTELARSQVASITLPPTLRRLEFVGLAWLAVNLRPLSIPLSVRHLVIESAEGIHPVHLPRLPLELHTLRFGAPRGINLTPFVDLFPEGLQLLQVDMVSLFPVMCSTALARRPLLKHNLLVYQEGCERIVIPELKLRQGRKCLVVDVSRYADYPSVVVPFGLELLVCNRGETQECPVSLSSISHWFPQLSKVHLRLPLLLDGVLFPPTLEVTVQTTETVPDAVWCIPRMTLLELGPLAAHSVPQQLAQALSLHLLSITLCGRLGERIPAPPNVKSLSIKLQQGAALPDLRGFAAATETWIEGESSECVFDPGHLPPNTTHLSIKGNMTSGAYLRLVRSMHFEHLACLETLLLDSRLHVDLDAYVLPTTLDTLKLSRVATVGLSGVLELCGLRELHLADCGIKNPWAVGQSWLPWRAPAPVVYPSSLFYLSISGCRDMAPPPPEFVFPPLQYLAMRDCGITDITAYHLPDTLGLLDVDGNDFPIPVDYAWPPLTWLEIKNTMEHGAPLTPQEHELLRQQIPGVRVNA